MARKTAEYGNDSIQALKGADRVRKRPAVIFGSDGIEGCEHSIFEILSNSIDEAREGHGDKIIITKYLDHSVEVEDFGRGIPVDYNNNEKKYNWELVFCELYAGGKYRTNEGESYEFSLGLNGLGLCATQYASEYMDVEIFRDGYQYNLRFERESGRVPESNGSRIWTFLPTLMCPMNTTPKYSSVRQWSTPDFVLCCGYRQTRALTNRNSFMKKALWTMSKRSPAKIS